MDSNASGNPFFLNEFTRYMVSSRAERADKAGNVTSFDDFAADGFGGAIRTRIAGPYMERRLMICSVHRVATHDIHVGRAYPAS